MISKEETLSHLLLLLFNSFASLLDLIPFWLCCPLKSEKKAKEAEDSEKKDNNGICVKSRTQNDQRHFLEVESQSYKRNLVFVKRLT